MPSILNPLGRFAGGFYSGMQKRKGFESDTRAEKARLFGEMRKQFPRATQEDLEGMLDRLTPHGESWQTSHLRSDDFLSMIAGENKRKSVLEDAALRMSEANSQIALRENARSLIKQLILNRPSQGKGSSAEDVKAQFYQMLGGREKFGDLDFSITDQLLRDTDTQDWVQSQQQVLELVNNPYYQITPELIAEKFGIPLERAMRMVDHAQDAVSAKKKALEQKLFIEVTDWVEQKSKSGDYDDSNIKELFTNVEDQFPDLQWTDKLKNQISNIATQEISKIEKTQVREFTERIINAVSTNAQIYAGQILHGNANVIDNISPIVNQLSDQYPPNVVKIVKELMATPGGPLVKGIMSTLDMAAQNLQSDRQQDRRSNAAKAGINYATENERGTKAAFEELGGNLGDKHIPPIITSILDGVFRDFTQDGVKYVNGWDEARVASLGMEMEIALNQIANSGLVLNPIELSRIAGIWQREDMRKHLTPTANSESLLVALQNDQQYQSMVSTRTKAAVAKEYGDRFQVQPLTSFSVYMKNWDNHLQEELATNREIFADIKDQNQQHSTPEERIIRYEDLQVQLARFLTDSQQTMEWEKANQIDFITVGSGIDSQWNDNVTMSVLSQSATAVNTLNEEINAELTKDRQLATANASATPSMQLLNGTVNLISAPNTNVPPSIDWVQYADPQKNADLLRDRGGLSALMQLWDQHTRGGIKRSRTLVRTWDYNNTQYNAPGVNRPSDKLQVREAADDFLASRFKFNEGIEGFIDYLNKTPGGNLLLADLLNKP